MLDGEFEEVENPENSSGPSLFRFVMFKATDKVWHKKKKVETGEAKDDANVLDFAVDDVGFGLDNEGQPQSIAEHVVGKQFHVRFHWHYLAIG